MSDPDVTIGYCVSLNDPALSGSERHQNLPLHGPFYDATKWVPANGRLVLSYYEYGGRPNHEIVEWFDGKWFDLSYAHSVVEVERWTELPYPADATNPPAFDVRAL